MGYIPEGTINVLGATLGSPGRGPSPAETDRLAKAVQVCLKCGALPSAMTLKRQVAQAMGTTKGVWGLLLNGRAATQGEK